MTNYEMFERQFDSIISNCEINKFEYESFILEKAKKIIYDYYLQSPEDSPSEYLLDYVYNGLIFAEKMIQPF